MVKLGSGRVVGSRWGRGFQRVRAIFVGVLALALSVMTLQPVIAAGVFVPEPGYDWWLIEIRADECCEEVVDFSYNYEYFPHLASDGDPVVWGTGAGYLTTPAYWTTPGGQVRIGAFGNDGAAVSMTQDLGSHHAQLTPPEPYLSPIHDQKVIVYGGGWMQPGGVYYGLEFWTNGSIRPSSISFHASSNVTVTHRFGIGAVAVKVSDPANQGSAIEVAGEVIGETTAHASPTTGIAGGYDYCQKDCQGEWRAPDGRSGRWRSNRSPGQGSYIDGLTYAGPAGDWSWTWSGYSGSGFTASRVLTAYAPVGDAWPAFVCPVADELRCRRISDGILQ